MASVSVDKRTTSTGVAWRARWRDRTGKQRQQTFTRRRDADAFATRVELDLRAGTYQDPALRRATFGAHYDQWLEARRISPQRAKAEASYATCHVLPRWEVAQIGGIEHAEVQAWVNDLRDRLAWATVKGCLGVLTQVLDGAVRARHIPHNPADGVRVPGRPLRDITSDDVLEVDELARLEAASSSRWRAWFHCCGWLGWRLSEGCAIERRDVDLRAATVTIRGTKTRAATRVIPLPTATVTVLREHMRAFVLDPSPNALVFSSTGAVMDRSVMRRQLLGTLERAGLAGRGLDYRQLRHTAASLMLAAGVNPVDVSYRLGHSRPSTTADIYTHLMPRVMDEGTARMDALMAGAG